MRLSAKERFDAKTDKSGGPDACWPWIGVADETGRGHFWIDKHETTAPRAAWILHHGTPLPKHLLACHTCDNPSCVNPIHIFAGTHSDNTNDSANKGRHFPKKLTKCKRGHLFTPENTRHYNGKRHCRTCMRDYMAARRAKKRTV